MDRLPLCKIFLTFLRSRGGSLSSLINKEVALGSTEAVACLFWIANCTVMRMPFQAWVALIMSSPTFLGDIPRGPILGAKTEEAAASPPTWRRQTYLTSV